MCVSVKCAQQELVVKMNKMCESMQIPDTP